MWYQESICPLRVNRLLCQKISLVTGSRPLSKRETICIKKTSSGLSPDNDKYSCIGIVSKGQAGRCDREGRQGRWPVSKLQRMWWGMWWQIETPGVYSSMFENINCKNDFFILVGGSRVEVKEAGQQRPCHLINLQLLAREKRTAVGRTWKWPNYLGIRLDGVLSGYSLHRVQFSLDMKHVISTRWLAKTQIEDAATFLVFLLELTWISYPLSHRRFLCSINSPVGSLDYVACLA